MFDPSMFDEISAGRAGLITASNRQSLHWMTCYHQQHQKKQKVWQSPNIQPITLWIEQLVTRLSVLKKQKDQPVENKITLDRNQVSWIWQRMVENSDSEKSLISSRATAKKAQEAWQQLAEYQIEWSSIQPTSDDHRAFLQWASDFTQLLQQNRWQDPALLLTRLMDEIQQDPSIVRSVIPYKVYLVGFLQVTPQQQSFFDLLKKSGIECIGLEMQSYCQESGEILGIVASDFEAEIKSACRWLSKCLKHQPEGRFALVVPGLDQKRYQVNRIAASEFHPEHFDKPDIEQSVYNLSIGTPLAIHPIFRSALLLIQALVQGLEVNEWAELLRSPFLGVWQNQSKLLQPLAFELNQKLNHRVSISRLLSHLLSELKLAQQKSFSENTDTSSNENKISTDTLIRPIENAPKAKQPGPQNSDIQYLELSDRFQTIEKFIVDCPGKTSPQQWSDILLQWLNLWQWPGRDSLDSQLFQLKEFIVNHVKALREMAIVQTQCNLSEAVRWLRNSLDGKTFQAKSQGEPIQILGLYEVLGQTFDGVWISGLNNEHLPEPTSPNPFIPIVFSRAHSLPGANPDKELEYAQNLLTQLLATSNQLVVSYYQQEGEKHLNVTPLLKDSIETWQSADQFLSLSITSPTQSFSTFELFVDDYGCSWQGETLANAVQVLKDQSQCPIRGYLTHRLKINEQQPLQEGIDPRDRGIWVHRVMQGLWEKIGNQKALLELDDDKLSLLIEQEFDRISSNGNLHTDLLFKIEKKKFVQWIFELMQIEKQRSPFEVFGSEENISVTLDGVVVQGRVDRIDQLANHGKVLLDYKTGEVSISDWFGERMEDPQLPLYLMSEPIEIEAIVFAQLHHSGIKMMGISEREDIIPGVKTVEKMRVTDSSWSEFIERSESQLKQLMQEIKSGCATVTPTKNACRYCAFDSVCRVDEFNQDQDDIDNKWPMKEGVNG